MSISLLYEEVRKKLSIYYQDALIADQYAKWMLAAIFKKDFAFLMINIDEVMITKEQLAEVDYWLEQLTEHDCPIAYLIGSVPFGPLTIDVVHPVLIPRIETESWALDYFTMIKSKVSDAPLRILDLYTGSGCIGLLAASMFPCAEVVMIDIAEYAVLLAQQNQKKLGIVNAVVVQGNALEYLSDKPFDIVLANPPYIDHDDWMTLSPSVTAWEDYQALVSDDGGYADIQSLIARLPQLVRYNQTLASSNIPQVMIEIGHAQKNHVFELLKQYPYVASAMCIQDEAQKDRVIGLSIAK